MKKPKGIKPFHISVVLLIVAITGSGYLYKREADKSKNLTNKVREAADSVIAVRNDTPTDEYRQILEKQKKEIEDNFKTIVNKTLEWNHVPEQEMSPATFQGEMWKIIGNVRDAAKKSQILVGQKAANLGFDQYAATPPAPEEDLPQLQRELSAATDIADLLIASDVFSIDLMARREDALMEEGTGGTVRTVTEFGTSTKRKRVRVDLYDTVPFRIKFSCTYPALASFMRYLIAPKKLSLTEYGTTVERPRNFFVVNDLWFKVKETERDDADVMRSGALERARVAAWAMHGAKAPPIPDDLEGALALWQRDPQGAMMLFRQWYTWTPEQKKLYLLEKRLREQITDLERERLAGEYERIKREFQDRQKLQGRPPEYNIIEVTMLIDLVQFNDDLTAGLETDKAKDKRGTSVATVMK